MKRGWYDNWHNGVPQPDLRLIPRGFDMAAYEEEQRQKAAELAKPSTPDVTFLVGASEAMAEQFVADYSVPLSPRSAQDERKSEMGKAASLSRARREASRLALLDERRARMAAMTGDLTHLGIAK